MNVSCRTNAAHEHRTAKVAAPDNEVTLSSAAVLFGIIIMIDRSMFALTSWRKLFTGLSAAFVCLDNGQRQGAVARANCRKQKAEPSSSGASSMNANCLYVTAGQLWAAMIAGILMNGKQAQHLLGSATARAVVDFKYRLIYRGFCSRDIFMFG